MGDEIELFKAIEHVRRVQDAQGKVLQTILQHTEKLMSQLDDANAALAAINAATTQQGVTLAAEGTSLQTISDNLDALIVQLGTNVPPAVLAGLTAAASSTQALSDSMTAQAAFATAVASKGVATPVPLPVPPPTPIPAP